MDVRRVWLVALLFASACGAAPGQGALPQPSPPIEALARWKNFPAHQHPRPVIAFEDTVEHIQAGGFPTNDRKIAWFCNRFVFASGVTLSSSTPAAADAEGGSFPSISSMQAYSALMASRAAAGGGKSPDCAKKQPFVITAVRYASAGFHTDRGSMTMSAWLFDISEVNAYIGNSAIDPSHFWGGGLSDEGRGARVSADGMTLKIPVANAEPGPCGSDYTAAAAESDVAVAVAVRQIPHATPGTAVACPLVLRMGYIEVKLKSPLGDRVLVDERGKPGTACPEAGGC